MLWNIIKISSLTLLSKIIGFVRDIIIANIFGINEKTDSFYTALKLPNIFKKIFSEGIFSYVFIPIISEYKTKKNKKKTEELISSTYFIILFILIILTILGIFFSKEIIYIISPGFIKNYIKTKLTIKILRIIFPYIILISLTTYLSSISNIWNIFIPQTFIPIILNITIIIYSLHISKYFNKSIYFLSWSIIIGGILQLIYQKININKIPIKINIKNINIYNKGIKKIIKNIHPVILSMSIYQISQIMNNKISSYFKSGSISWIYYADRLIELPLGILGTVIGNMLLTKLSNSFHKKNINKYKKIINQYLKIIIILSIPISIILIITSKILIITLFKYGKFNYLDVIMTSKILISYTIGLTGLIFIKILTPCFYSRYNTKTPIEISIITLITTQLINIFTIKIFKYAGLALSISISSYISTLLLFWKLIKNKIIDYKYNWKLFFLRIIFSCINMYIISKILINKLTINFINLNFKFRLIKLLLILIISTLTYIISIVISGMKIKEINK